MDFSLAFLINSMVTDKGEIFINNKLCGVTCLLSNGV